MNEETVKLREDVNWPKRIVVAVLIAILVIGGAVAAYIALNSTPKNKYFQAESNSLEFIKEVFKDRYEPELTWSEKAKEKPVKSTYTLSANYEDQSTDFDLFSPAAFINHSTITIETEKDVKEKQLATKLHANLGTIEVGDLSFYVTDKQVMLSLPFLEEVLFVKEDDIGTLLHNFDDEVDPNKNYNLSVLFDGPNKLITDKQKSHIEQEYIDMIYEELPEEAFTSTKETVEINNESIKTEKIEFHLSEKEIKKLLEKVIDKMSKDDTLKAMIRDMVIQQIDLGMSFTSLSSKEKEEIDELMDDYEEVLQEVKNEIGFMIFKDGINSTLWIHKGLIVKRDFQLAIGESEDEIVKLQVEGTQLLKKDEQYFDYNLQVSDKFDESSVNITASFKNDSGKSTDSIILAFDEGIASYHGDETLKDKKREFERSLTLEDEFGEPFKLTWSGNSSYERDKMNSDHSLKVDFEMESDESFELQLAKTSEQIKEVTIPDDNLKDLGAMSEDEFDDFLVNDIATKFEQWLFGIIGGGFFDM